MFNRFQVLLIRLTSRACQTIARLWALSTLTRIRSLKSARHMRYRCVRAVSICAKLAWWDVLVVVLAE